MTIKEIMYEYVTGGVSTNAIREAAFSYLPGRENGPADAYRHVLLAAELTRRYGEETARMMLDLHEFTGNMDGQTPEAEAMDRHNNELGISIGNELRLNSENSWIDVVVQARELMNPSIRNGEGAQWLDKSQWDKNPTDENGNRIPSNDPRLNWPVEWKYGPYYEDFTDRSNLFLDNHTTQPDFMLNDLLNSPSFISQLLDGWNIFSDPDTDRDGIPDHMDPDMDGDGVPNDQDSDTDGDGLPDDVDPNPLTPDSGRSNGFPPGYDPASGKGYSPLVLDLDGNGIHTTAITLSRTFYDLDNDGMAELVGWSDGKDGFLAYDRDGDGVIENGSELFGDHTYLSDGSHAPNGFEALAEYDGDGRKDIFEIDEMW